MLHRLVDHKVCSICKEDKPASEFKSDLSRIDALKFCCNSCGADYVPKKQKKVFDNVTKTCLGCGRELPARAFSYSQHTSDRLSAKCRTCKQHKGSAISASKAEEFEILMSNVYSGIVIKLLEKYDMPQEELLEKHRGEFEECVYKAMLRQGLLGEWNLPAWLHPTSIPE